MKNQFRGFSPDSFAFFRELARNNHKLWFDANRERYERHVTGAFRDLLVALEPFLLKLNPHFETAGKTNRNFSRINRDIRFSKDKSPYKSNYYLYVFDSRRARDTDGRLYIGLSADCVTVGFSIYASWKKGVASTLETVFRPRLAKDRAAFDRILEKSVRKSRYETYWYRMEKRDWTLHPGLPKKEEDWQSLQGWVVRKIFEPRARGLNSPAFVKQVEKIFAGLYPLYLFTSVTSPQGRRGGQK
ncbi:MAG: DUF2461 family protein [Terriglobia bacterium]